MGLLIATGRKWGWGSVSRAALCGLTLVSVLQASQSWSKLTSKHFELYTDNSPGKAAAFLRDMEQVRGAFVLVNPPNAAEFRVRIIAFRSQAEYGPYSSNPHAAAYFLAGHHRDFIVLQDLEPEHRPIAVHEYTHAQIALQGLRLPPWLDEGLAEVYSTIRQTDRELVIGTPPRSRLPSLRASRLLDLNSLFAAETRSGAHSGATEWLGLFYAQSWLLTHMLKFSPSYNAGFDRFLAAVGKGESVGDSLAKVYGKSLNLIADDLSHYLSGRKFESERIARTQTEPAPFIQMQEAPSTESDTVLGDLLATLRRFDSARPILQQLSRQHPHIPQIEEALAYLFLRENNLAEAGWYFSQAAADGNDNPRLYYDYARLMLAQGMPTSAAAPLLERALLLEPHYNDARKQLDSILPRSAQRELGFVASANPSFTANIQGWR